MWPCFFWKRIAAVVVASLMSAISAIFIAPYLIPFLLSPVLAQPLAQPLAQLLAQPLAQPLNSAEPLLKETKPVADQSQPATIEPTTDSATDSAKMAPLQGGAKYYGPIETSGTLLTGRAGSAPSRIYKGWLNDAHPQLFLGAKTIAEDRLVVITDKYDQAERTLKTLGLPFKSMDKKELDSFDLSQAQVLVIDCGPKNLSYTAGMKIREFVCRGGYLLTTDWMLDRLDQKIFPGYIAWSGALNAQRMYDASIVGKDHVLFRHAVTRANWKMDMHCHLIRVINKELVRVLAVSTALAKDDPDG